MKPDDHPEDIADELIRGQVVPPSSQEEAMQWVYYNCDHYSGETQLKVIGALMRRRKEYDAWEERKAEIAREVRAEMAEERYREQNPYWDNPRFGTWG